MRMPTFAFYTNSVSVHQLPLARELVKRLGADNYRYIYTGDNLQGGNQEVVSKEPWILRAKPGEGSATAWLETCDVLVSGIRDMDLIARREAKGLTTLYCSERWFKPWQIIASMPLALPGKLRMLLPRYRRMVKRFVKWLTADPNARYLAVGPWARRDMLWLGVPEEKLIPWGYFVDPAEQRSEKPEMRSEKLNVLWVGRSLWWKRVDTIRKAVAHVRNATLHVFTGISLAQVREEMRRHDVYVLASNAIEGWGAVVNEALSEGMTVLGTYEAGASAALLPKENLFHAGDWRALAKMLSERSYVHSALPSDFTPSGAAERLMKLYGSSGRSPYFYEWRYDDAGRVISCANLGVFKAN